MAQFKIDIQKSFTGLFWTNRYIVEAADLAAAADVGETIMGAEQTLTISAFTMDKYRVSTGLVGDDSYVIVPVNEPGSREATGALLPLFNVARADFAPASGRPSRKYLRCGITADDLSALVTFALDAAFVSALQAYADALVALPEFVDPQGQTFITGSAVQLVAMHQLRRGSRRPTEPVI